MNARIRTKVHVFVASPRDVDEERHRLVRVVEQLNRGLADWLGLTIELLRWETHVAPDTGRPEGVILDQLPPNQWDIFIGILWLRFGTGTGGSDPDTGQPYLAGTEEEFKAARQYRQASGSPWPKVMFYRCMRPPADLSLLDVTQYRRVVEFFKGFAAAGSHPGLVSEYQQPEDFEHLVREHLEKYLHEFTEARGLGQPSTSTQQMQPAPNPAHPVLHNLPQFDSEDKEVVTRITIEHLGGERLEGQDHMQEMLRSLLRGLSRPTLPQEIIEGARKKLCPENPPEQLLGRRALLEEGCRRLHRGELPILVWGIPGIGKSAFLAALVNKPEVQEKYENNIFWINLRESGVSTASEIADVIARGLHFSDVLYEKISGPKLRMLQAALSDALPGHLIVFDNADLEHEGELLRIYQQVTKNIVVGSRTRFAIRDTEPLLLRELDRQSAIQMFRLHAKVDTDDARIVPICKSIGNHPLAITLAAPTIWLNNLTLEELAKNLDLKKLEVLSRGVKHSEQDIRTSIALSYDDLASPDERDVFDAIGAFALNGAPLSAIARVTALPCARCKLLLSRLQSRSLAQEDERNPGHYRLHPLLYEFARERLHEQESLMMSEGTRFEDIPTGRMINFYVEYTDKHREDFPALEAAHDNVIHAAEWAWKNNAWEAVYNLWEASEGWLDATGDWNNLASLLEWTVQANRILKNREIELAKTLHSRSTYFELTGKIEAAMEDAKESLALGHKVEDRKTVASGLVRVGSISDYYGNVEQAHTNFKEAWRIGQDLLDWDESAYIAYQLGWNYWSRGNPTTARDLFEKSINISKKFPSHRVSRRYEAFCVTSLGNLLVEQEEYEQAREHLERSLELKLKLGDQYSTAISIASLAWLESKLGHFEKAITLQNDALKIYEEIGAASASLRTLREIGDAYCQQERYREAVASYEEAKTLGLSTELSNELATTLLGLGTAYYELGHYDEALAALHERLKALDTLLERDSYKVGITLRDIGKVYYRQGDLNRAQSYFEQARQILLEIGVTDILPQVFLQIGQEYTELGNHNKALVAYKEGLDMAQGLPQEDARLKGAILYRMGRSYAALERHHEAIDFFEQARQILRDVATPLEIVIVLENLETTYRVIEKKNKVDEVHRAIETTLTEASRSTDIHILQELVSYYIDRERLSNAQIVLDRANTLLEQYQAGEPNKREIRDVGLLYIRLGRAYEQGQRYDEALVHYQQAVQLLESKVESQFYGVLMHDIGDVYRAKKLFEQALSYYEKALKYKDDQRGIIMTLRTMGDVHVDTNQHEKAIAVYQEALGKLDSLLKEAE